MMNSMIVENAVVKCCACYRAEHISAAFSPRRRNFIIPRRGFAKASQNHYDVLQVPKTASYKEIRTAFVKLSKELHPDKNLGDPQTHSKFVALNEAYTVLSKPKSRRDYDVTQAFRSPMYPPPGARPHDTYQSASTSEFKGNIYGPYYSHAREHHHFMSHEERVKANRRVLMAAGVIVSLGFLYFLAGLVWSKKRLEERRQRDIEISKVLEELQAKARGYKSNDEILHLMSLQQQEKKNKNLQKNQELNKIVQD